MRILQVYGTADDSGQKYLDRTFIQIAIEVTEILVQLHSSEIIHGDIKNDNIFVHQENSKEEKLQFKLADFNVIQNIIENQLWAKLDNLDFGQSGVGSNPYCDVEFYEDGKIDAENDIF